MGTDLVAELHHEHDASIRQQQALKRARRRRKVIATITVLVLLVIAGVAAKLGFDAFRHSRALSAAREHLDAGTPGDLTMAASEVDKGLAIKPDDDEAKSILALVRAHEAVLSGQTEALRTSLEGLDEADHDEARLAKSVAELLEGDIEAARASHESATTLDGRATKRMSAWVAGALALAHPYEDENVSAAIGQLESAIAHDPWPPGHRWLAALLARAGRMDDALTTLAAAREAAPSDLGVSVDEALLHALVAQHDAGVLGVTERLRATKGLSPRARARVTLARAIVMKRRGEDEAAELREEAWETAPKWDVDTLDLVVTAAYIAAEEKEGAKRLDELDLDEPASAIYEAWGKLLAGEETAALTLCSKLPQSRPRVAYVQALALAEQHRWQEADPWIDRAKAGLGNLVELRVAKARANAHTGDAKAAIKELDELADEYPHASRVFTALGEAHLATWEDREKDDPPAAAKKSLKKALDREPRPAEAAYLLGTLYEHEAQSKASRADKALDMYDKAVELRAKEPRYRIAYGEYLATHGSEDKAREVLRELVDVDPSVGSALVTLARLEVQAASETGEAVKTKDINAWLAKAAQGGATADELTMARAEVALATTAGPIPAATMKELTALIGRDAKNIGARALHSRALIRAGELRRARASLEYGIKHSLKVLDGRLYLAQAEVEAADRGDKYAARLAYKGWEKVEAEPRPPNELLRYAQQTAAYWESIDNAKVPRSIAKGLTTRAPYRAAAWAFRAEKQARDGYGPEACASADKALELDEDLPAAHAAQAECHIAKFEYPKARAALDKAIEMTKNEDELRRFKRRRRVIR